VDELEPITYLIQGRLAPFFEPVEIGLGERLLMTAIAAAYGAPKEEVTKLNRQTGDLGVTAQRLAPASKRKSPSVVDVHKRLSAIAAASGDGSQQQKLDGFTGLLSDLDPISAKHLVRITLGKMRLGIGDPTVLDALSFAKKGDRSLRPVLEAAYNRTSTSASSHARCGAPVRRARRFEGQGRAPTSPTARGTASQSGGSDQES